VVAVLDRLRRWLTGRLRPTAGLGGDDGTALFKERYHALRLLLAANNKALDTMAEMEQTLAGGQLYGMAFVHSRCTAAGVSVFAMVRHLDELAPGTYRELFDVLDGIQGRIRGLLAAHPPQEDAPLVIPLSAVDRSRVDEVGSKMANLGEVANVVRLTVPEGFAITGRAYQLLLEHNDLQPEINRLIQTSDSDEPAEIFRLSSELQQLVVKAEVPAELGDAIESAYEDLAAAAGGRPSVALRSSAVGEDSPEASFAGQYATELNLRPEHLAEAYRQVVASKYTPQAMQYRLQRGLRDDRLAMCVGCTVMVDARAGGVAYSANPGDSRDDTVVVSSTFGLPKSVVDGRFAADQFILSRERPPRILKRRIADKRARLVLDPAEGVSRQEVPAADRSRPSLSDEEAARVAAAALDLEDHYGLPQDVEWAIDGAGDVVVLQSRPLQQVVEADAPLPARPQDLSPLLEGGLGVSPGRASGPVIRVERDSDALRFPDGAVLVVSHPLPRWAALLSRAVAVVAAEGGIAGHLATVARESGVPALFGVSALEALEEGAVVTVDADGGAVYPGRVEALLGEERARPSAMEGSPVHATLRDALRLISPLNLLDPDDVSFRPSACRTLHDITRFCHEKAVREMFDFGKSHRFPRHASKQLHHNVPMQWWVLDLEDGFTHEITGKYVRLGEIASRPMLAVWRGMIAVPWEGPPAMSGRGFASVLFEATANPALATPFRTPYAQQNYFMISKRFMNLQSRFGFHFAAVESVIGDRDHENYLSFSFKGGAADLARKAARVRLICELLDERGFTVEAREDHATARLAGLPAAAMERQLEVVGYLIMHTRQLDMIMGNPAAVAHYASKIRTDLERLDSADGPAGGDTR
jgi:pyruvate,water dikinase